ncbi:unnamed protein product [Microthlaspi erraticum]|uniref:Elicitor peptide 3 n=1 Tax=Microthlaspi erraticum TaxID=1685480 RepID=A0A6D2IZW8_9BRAS|nr:unnamed protein product [Microthlaspi erraticum]
MENLRNGEENDSYWIPSMFFDRSSVTIPLLKCFGLESSSSSSPTSSSSSSSCGSLLSSHSEEEDSMEIIKEEEDNTTVEITERRLQKSKPKPNTSSGKGGKVN